MPNWTRNIINVYGKKEDVVNFVETHIKNHCFDFGTIIPEPKTREECDPAYIHSDEEIEGKIKQNQTLREHGFGDMFDLDDDSAWFNWYNWRIDNWGTKWNAKVAQFFDIDALKNFNNDYVEILISFDTAWSEPTPIFEKLNEMYKNSDLMIHCEYYSFENWDIGHYTNDYEDEEHDCPKRNINYEIGRRNK